MANRDKSLLSLNKSKYLKAIARETARMSYPGAMSMQPKGKQIVISGTKKDLEKYFEENFQKLWDKKFKTQQAYDGWHKRWTEKIAKEVIRSKHGNKKNNNDAISAKFLDTFMHQLIKCERFRYLHKYLHLPLDGQVFKKLAQELDGIENPQSLKKLQDIAQEYKNHAYRLDYKVYQEIQKKLDVLKKYLNNVLKSKGMKLKSRVDLNCILWATESKSSKNHKKRK